MNRKKKTGPRAVPLEDWAYYRLYELYWTASRPGGLGSPGTIVRFMPGEKGSDKDAVVRKGKALADYLNKHPEPETKIHDAWKKLQQLTPSQAKALKNARKTSKQVEFRRGLSGVLDFPTDAEAFIERSILPPIESGSKEVATKNAPKTTTKGLGSAVKQLFKSRPGTPLVEENLDPESKAPPVSEEDVDVQWKEPAFEIREKRAAPIPPKTPAFATPRRNSMLTPLEKTPQTPMGSIAASSPLDSFTQQIRDTRDADAYNTIVNRDVSSRREEDFSTPFVPGAQSDPVRMHTRKAANFTDPLQLSFASSVGSSSPPGDQSHANVSRVTSTPEQSTAPTTIDYTGKFQGLGGMAWKDRVYSALKKNPLGGGYYNYCGPFTKFKGQEAVDATDSACKIHDDQYAALAVLKGKIPEEEFNNLEREADLQLLETMQQTRHASTQAEFMSMLAKRAVQLKLFAENKGLLPRGKFISPSNTLETTDSMEVKNDANVMDAYIQQRLATFDTSLDRFLKGSDDTKESAKEAGEMSERTRDVIIADIVQLLKRQTDLSDDQKEQYRTLIETKTRERIVVFWDEYRKKPITKDPMSDEKVSPMSEDEYLRGAQREMDEYIHEIIRQGLQDEVAQRVMEEKQKEVIDFVLNHMLRRKATHEELSTMEKKLTQALGEQAIRSYYGSPNDDLDDGLGGLTPDAQVVALESFNDSNDAGNKPPGGDAPEPEFPMVPAGDASGPVRPLVPHSAPPLGGGGGSGGSGSGGGGGGGGGLLPNAGALMGRQIEDIIKDEKTGGDVAVGGVYNKHDGNDVLRLDAAEEADPWKTVPPPLAQIRSDIEFDMFSVVRPGFGLGTDNKMFVYENARDDYIVHQKPEFLPRPYDGPGSGVDTVPLSLQNVLPPDVFKAHMARTQRLELAAKLTASATKKGSLNILGDDYGQLDSISDRGLNRPSESFLEPVIRIDSRWSRVKPEPGYMSSKRQFRKLYDSLRYPEHMTAHMNMDGGPVLKKNRASLQVMM